MSSGIFGSGRTFAVELNAAGIGKIVIGDVDVAAAVRGFVIEAAAPGRGLKVELDLTVFNTTKIASEATEISMTSATERLLLEAGWRPPAPGKAEGEAHA